MTPMLACDWFWVAALLSVMLVRNECCRSRHADHADLHTFGGAGDGGGEPGRFLREIDKECVSRKWRGKCACFSLFLPRNGVENVLV